MIALLLGAAAGAATLIGGFVAMRVQDRKHLVLGAAGGIILGVIAFDLLPEAFTGNTATLQGIPWAMIVFLGGFLTIHVLEKALELHSANAGHFAAHSHSLRPLGLAAGGALIGHSFMDGLSIGISAGTGASLAITVAIAVLAHDFADGFNTYTLTSMYGNRRSRALLLLGLDAVAPLLGAAVGTFLPLGDSAVALYLAYFAGFLLHIATSNVLPEAHADHPAWGTLATTVGGVVFMGAVMAVVH